MAGDGDEITKYFERQAQFGTSVTPAREYSLPQLRQALKSARAVRLGIDGGLGQAGGLVSSREKELADELTAREAADENGGDRHVNLADDYHPDIGDDGAFLL